MKWISVKDRLPYNGTKCNRSVLTYNGKSVQLQMFNTVTGNFLTAGYTPIEDVIYWQPLPPPPKVAGNE